MIVVTIIEYAKEEGPEICNENVPVLFHLTIYSVL